MWQLPEAASSPTPDRGEDDHAAPGNGGKPEGKVAAASTQGIGRSACVDGAVWAAPAPNSGQDHVRRRGISGGDTAGLQVVSDFLRCFFVR